MSYFKSSVLFIGILSKFISIDSRRKIFTRCIMNTEDEIETHFRDLIKNHNVLVFSKITCPFCIKVKRIFNDLEVQTKIFELNEYPAEKCSQMQDVLQRISAQRTVPNVFIGGQHVGGCSDTEKYLKDGTLLERIQGSYQQYQYDYIVVGGGSGGLASAKEAASLGRRVALCDYVVPSPQNTSWGLGGTCVNVGCIPKKLMHKAAILGEDFRDCAHYGWNTDNKEHVWSEMVENVQNYILGLNSQYRRSLRQNNVTYYNAYAKFKDKHTLVLTSNNADEEIITGQNILLATGCRPKYPDIPGAFQHCISSDDVFSLQEPPGKTLIIGGSYIALETAGFLHSLGFDVTVMVRSILLRGFDQEIANKIGKHMRALGVKFVEKCVPTEVIRNRSGANKFSVRGLSTDGSSSYLGRFETVMVAIGRDACITDLGLENIGVECQRGKVTVNAENRTLVPNIFAVGDIIEDHLQLTPVAIQAGKLLAKRLFGRSKTMMDYKCVPTTVFTPLEYGCVGLSEEQAISEHGLENIEVYHANFEPLEWAISKRNKDYPFAKLVCLKTEKERVVGFHYLGPNAGEVTQGFALALKLGATKDDFDNLVGIHPTCAEIFTTMTITKASGQSADSKGC